MDSTSRSYARVLAYGTDAGEVEAMRRGSEAAFRSLVAHHTDTLFRIAKTWTQDRSVAEEVVQQTWVEVLEGFAGFEGRSSVKTWLCGICINLARDRARKERRTIPLSSTGAGDDTCPEPPVLPSFFHGPDSDWAGHWVAFPRRWPASPEDSAQHRELLARLEAAIEMLPESQRTVFSLRDIEGFSSDEVGEMLGVNDGHQRVLLHRARSRLRAALAEFFDGAESPS